MNLGRFSTEKSKQEKETEKAENMLLKAIQR